MAILPPGTWLQLMYLKERILNVAPGSFVEIGPGSGEISHLLLELGWRGRAYDLEPTTIERLRSRFAGEIAQGRYDAENADYLSLAMLPEEPDLVISCMVMEHLDENAESEFVRKSAAFLSDRGMMIGFVPSSPDHWGLEDEIAGHYRRYTRERIRDLLSSHHWDCQHLAGLTYPISNMMLPISNYLVKRNEEAKLKLSLLERTKQSGRRKVPFKTHFPRVFGLILNPYALLPLHLLQKRLGGSRSALVLYFEGAPRGEARSG
jgi:SAM-dependent methyltransferase